ncbi:Predicted ATPase [Sphingomonas laterariae]|uniref:Predicted ATPase n=1 Tax=Edaphosphingomonas laterariae TaxID=861865 RepID=A0A239BQ95_9SPHN|nr:AAA family ATPase [Sphingomonas laterariae]SNS10170.1 Predicted ATPase [Sphingomonas laterariae]
MDNFIVVTGGPGSGKTSLVDALAASGLRCMAEAGRAIIRDQSAIGGTALPWADRAAFAEQMLGWDMRSHHIAGETAAPVIFDRGIPDIIGYLRLCGLPVPTHMIRAARHFRYCRRVFIAPFWPAIFTQDAERRQDADEARATHDAMAEIYRELGYELIPLPLAPIADRVAFMREAIGA